MTAAVNPSRVIASDRQACDARRRYNDMARTTSARSDRLRLGPLCLKDAVSTHLYTGIDPIKVPLDKCGHVYVPRRGLGYCTQTEGQCEEGELDFHETTFLLSSPACLSG